jgi:hypothetical protein
MSLFSNLVLQYSNDSTLPSLCFLCSCSSWLAFPLFSHLCSSKEESCGFSQSADIEDQFGIILGSWLPHICYPVLGCFLCLRCQDQVKPIVAWYCKPMDMKYGNLLHRERLRKELWAWQTSKPQFIFVSLNTHHIQPL